MKKLFFRGNSPCFTHLFLFFTEKKKKQTMGRSGDVRKTLAMHFFFKNSTHKHITLALTGYSRRFSEL